MPHLQEECRNLDWSIYHWDGPGQIPHLDLLLDIPELTGIQWVPGAGKPGTGSPKWFDLYRRIQARGKRPGAAGHGQGGRAAGGRDARSPGPADRGRAYQHAARGG